MLDRVRNQIVWNGRESKMARSLARVVAAISNRVEALRDTVEELESALWGERQRRRRPFGGSAADDKTPAPWVERGGALAFAHRAGQPAESRWAALL